MKCRKCKVSMKKEASGDVFSMFLPSSYWCPNNKCDWYGVVVKAGIPEEKDKSKDTKEGNL